MSAAGTKRPGKAAWRKSLAEERHDLAKQWVRELNGDVTPESVSAGSQFQAAWRCERGCEVCGKPHVWYARVGERCLAGSGCPVCSGNKVCSCQSLANKHPRLMLEWDYEANKGVKPKKLACKSQKRVSWRCQECGHKWEAQALSRVLQGTGCPKCAVLKREHSKRGLLEDERPDIYEEVHPTLNAGINVSKLTCGSMRELVWLCSKNKESRPEGCKCKCKHTWKARVCEHCHKTHPKSCPFCAGNIICLCKSIARLYPDFMPFWDHVLNSRLDPEAVGAASCKKVWWQHVCVDGHMKQQNMIVMWWASSRIPADSAVGPVLRVSALQEVLSTTPA